MESASVAMSASKDWTTASLHRVLSMQGGEDEISYLKNCDSQALAITLSKPLLISSLQSIKLFFCSNNEQCSLRIADLGCATGSNTFANVDTVVETLQRRYKAVYGGGFEPEFEAFFCDLPSNDFNMLFKLLSEKKNGGLCRNYFAGAVAGSFYNRLFPRGSIHVAVSLSALHWLSKIPEKVLEKGSRWYNKGRTWIEGATKEVVEAYAEQSENDLNQFLRCRKEEMVKGGVLFILMAGRPSGSGSGSTTQFNDQDSRLKHPFTTTMEQAWQDLLDQGLIEEETRDGFNIPAYMRSPEEVAAGIKRCGGFKIDKMEYMKIIEHSDEKQEEWKRDPVSYGRARTNLVQAAIRPMLDAYLGPHLSHELFKRYENRVSLNRDFLSKTCFYGVVVVSAIRI